MSLPLFRPLLLASLLALAGAAQAATMTAPVAPSGNFTVQDTSVSGNPYYTFNISPSTSPLPAIYFDSNVPNQSVDQIRTTIANNYSAVAGMLSTATTCDTFPCSPATGTATATSTALTLANVSPFDYLAVHFGSNELFFHWATPQTSAILTAIDPAAFVAGLSNYRSYLTTPVPGALALFLGALGFLGLRRKLVQPAGAEPMAA
jgi:hypothetical protein